MLQTSQSRLLLLEMMWMDRNRLVKTNHNVDLCLELWLLASCKDAPTLWGFEFGSDITHTQHLLHGASLKRRQGCTLVEDCEHINVLSCTLTAQFAEPCLGLQINQLLLTAPNKLHTVSTFLSQTISLPSTTSEFTATETLAYHFFNVR